MFRLTATQQAPFTVSGEDARGNPAALEHILVTSSDETVVTIQTLAENSFRAVATGKPGTAQINLQADARIGDEEKLIFGSEVIEVIAGEAQVMKLTLGDPEEQETQA